MRIAALIVLWIVAMPIVGAAIGYLIETGPWMPQ